MARAIVKQREIGRMCETIVARVPMERPTPVLAIVEQIMATTMSAITMVRVHRVIVMRGQDIANVNQNEA